MGGLTPIYTYYDITPWRLCQTHDTLQQTQFRRAFPEGLANLGDLLFGWSPVSVVNLGKDGIIDAGLVG
jgi:hypothetical protein